MQLWRCLISVIIIIEAKIKPGKRAELLFLVRGALRPEALERGCTGIESYCHVENPNRITFHEYWESRDCFDKYVAWCMENGTMDIVLSYYVEMPTLLFAERMETQVHKSASAGV